MAIAAVAQIFAPNLIWLIAIRFILGIGVGADYVLSPTIMAEHANRADRGRSLGFGFSVTWWLGGAVAGLLLLVLHACGVAPDLIWRIVLAAGALPALSVLYLRRQMPETTRYLARMAGDTEAARAVTETVTGRRPGTVPPVDNRSFMSVFCAHLPDRFSARALLWFVFDIVIYSTVLFGPSLIAKGLGMSPAELHMCSWISVFIMPAVLIGALFLLDRFGRKPVHDLGLYRCGAGAGGCSRSCISDIMHNAVLGLVIFGAFNMLIMGPSMVSGSGILGVELAPTRIRTVAQSITVVGGRLGASLSAFVFPLLFVKLGENAAIGLLVGLSIVGAILTQIVIPETAGRSLEDLSGEVMEAAAAE